MGPLGLEAAPAKLNLALHVVGRRADGYHELHSLVAFADVADEIEVWEAPGDVLRVSGPFASSLSDGEGNLVVRALAAFRDCWPDRIRGGLALELRKNLPVAAGLGGGSADAAAALRLLARLSAKPVPMTGLQDLAGALGADVPMCLLSRPAEVRGIGELVRPISSFPACHAVLVNPLVPVDTGHVFSRLADHEREPLPRLPQPLSGPELALWLAGTRNDLEPPAIVMVPVIADLIADMQAAQGCWLARMSGSGGTVFGLFGSSAQAHQVAHDLREKWPDYWVAAAPVRGANSQ